MLQVYVTTEFTVVLEPVRRPFEGVPGLPQSTEKSEIVQEGRFGSNIKTRQHTLVVTCVCTVLAKNMLWLGTNIIDYKFEIH